MRAPGPSQLALLLALVPTLSLAADARPDPLREEAGRRHDALVKEGFNTTRGFTFGAAGARTELLVPPSDTEHELRFWAGTATGELAMRFGPAGGGTPFWEWSGPTGEVTLRRALPPGAYALEIESRGGSGNAVLGVKGPVIGECALERARAEEHPADPARGFHWPYVLVVPPGAKAGHLLVVPNSTGFVTEDLTFLRASASCEVARQVALAARLGTPLLVPLFPRPAAPGEEDNLYLHALSRAALRARAPAVARVDLQLLAMIDDARARLAGEKLAVSTRVLLHGFSASGSFVSRFAVLHPARVRAVAAGSPGGWPIAPVAAAGGEPLPYPVGIADVTALAGTRVDEAALRKVAWLFFLGAEDRNDSVPYRDSFTAADEALVRRRFGDTPVARWPAAERLWTGLGARFRLFPGVAHQVTPEMEAEVGDFLARAMAR